MRYVLLGTIPWKLLPPAQPVLLAHHHLKALVVVLPVLQARIPVQRRPRARSVIQVSSLIWEQLPA